MIDHPGRRQTMSKLSDDDRRAVDLILNRTAEVQEGKAVFAAPSQLPSQERLQAVEQVFALLENWVAEEPPADLAARTLQRIREVSAQSRGELPATLRPEPPSAPMA